MIFASPTRLYSDFALELTELIVNNQAWWSVGLDSFGGKENHHLDKIIQNYLINPFKLNLKVEFSYGYPHWLSRVFAV